MKKRANQLIIISLILILLVGILVALIFMPSNKKSEKSSENTTSENIINMTDKKITKISVKNKSDSFEVNITENGDQRAYSITDVSEDKISKTKIETFIDSVTNLKSTQTVAENPTDLSIYGLDKSTAELNITFSNSETVNLKIGNDAPLSKGVYMMKSGSQAVYLIDLSNKDIFVNTKDFYQETKKEDDTKK